MFPVSAGISSEMLEGTLMRKHPTYRLIQKLVALGATLVLVISLYASASAAGYPFTAYAKDKVNVRRSASSSATVLDKVEKDGAVTVLASSGNYYQVTVNNRTGYILKSYLTTTAPAGVSVRWRGRRGADGGDRGCVPYDLR